MKYMENKKKCIVEDYMRTPAITASIMTTFKEAVGIMMKYNVNSLVIVDDENKVVGILSSWDFVEYIVPDYLEEDKHLAAFESSDMFKTRIKQLANDPIGKFMRKRVHTIKKENSLMETATILSEFHVRQMPVVDDDGAPIGYINCSDIKKAISNVMESSDINKINN